MNIGELAKAMKSKHGIEVKERNSEELMLDRLEQNIENSAQVRAKEEKRRQAQCENDKQS